MGLSKPEGDVASAFVPAVVNHHWDLSHLVLLGSVGVIDAKTASLLALALVNMCGGARLLSDDSELISELQ